MAVYIDYKNKGYTIQFQTRGLTIEEANKIWNGIDIKRILDNTDETGHCLCVRQDNLAFDLERKGLNIVVRCGKEKGVRV